MKPIVRTAAAGRSRLGDSASHAALRARYGKASRSELGRGEQPTRTAQATTQKPSTGENLHSVSRPGYRSVEMAASPHAPSVDFSVVPERSLLEDGFPFAQVSALAQADRHVRDGVYAAHKWWARRPPSVIRALLVAGALPAKTTPKDFWTLYATDDELLSGVHVGDSFMGGATTLVEAARLGAKVTGIDVDRLAVMIATQELAVSGSAEDFRRHANFVLAYLQQTCGHLYATGDEDATPLHYFWLRRATCPDCEGESLIYRSPVLARDVGKTGAVVRRRGATAFCPECQALRKVPLRQDGFRCCGHLHRLDRGTYTRAGFCCPYCQALQTHDELTTATLPRELIAVEQTFSRRHREIRAPTKRDVDLIARATAEAPTLAASVPSSSMAGIDAGRPARYGIETVADLFSERQKVVFATAFSWIRGNDELAEAVRTKLLLAVSNALSANNLLCGYATDYGRLAPLFAGVRSYAMPILSVELNPLHPVAGRGTLPATLRRVERSLRGTVTRHLIDADTGETTHAEFEARRPTEHCVKFQSADRPFPTELGRCDFFVTDPPYFDFIAYSDLSLLHRAWLWPSGDSLGGKPIYPVGADPVGDFAIRLGKAFANATKALKLGGSITFTFHSAHEQAWDALAGALARAKLMVTGVFPVWADGRAAAHGHPGNCEWDVVFTCRPASRKVPTLGATVEGWIDQLGQAAPLGEDITNLRLGLRAALRVNEHIEAHLEQG